MFKRIGVLIFCAFCLLVSSTQAVEIGLKLAGGLSFLNPENVNRTLLDWVEWQKRDTAAYENRTFLSAMEPQISRGVEFEGELVVSLSKWLALSLGTGFIYSDIKPTRSEFRLLRPAGETILVQPRTLSAMPVLFCGYFRLPFSSLFSAYLKGGAGLLWAKYVEREGIRNIANAKFNYRRDESASARGPIYLGGLGLAIDTEPGIRFFLEGTYRWAKVKDYEGETQGEIRGPLFQYEELDYEFWQAKLRIQEQEPAGEIYRDVKKAEIDLSGFSLKLGIMFRF
jgi:hypothetical protein